MIDFTQVSALFADLHLLNRVHNSDDFERSLRTISAWIDRLGFRGKARIIEYPAGAEYNYWQVPKRWVVRRFSVTDPEGTRIADSSSHPLTLTPFSDSFSGKVTREELLQHVHTREDLPEAIPFVFRKMYRHWEKGWGIALPQRVVNTLAASHYEVDIQTEFQDRPMQVLEYTSPGDSPNITHLVAHLDHPGQCNDSLSGAVGALCVIHELESRFQRLNFTYSVLLCPEMIGSAAYLYNEPALAKKMRYCLSTNMLGHDAPVALCLSKSGDSLLDRALQLALLQSKAEHVVGLWHKYPDCGDDISYDAPGLFIPTSTISRIGDMFRHYHTSLDTPASVSRGRFEQAVQIMAQALGYIERDAVPLRKFIGNPALASPTLDLYLESANVSNRFNPAATIQLCHLKDGEPLDLRNFQEFVLSNLEGKAGLIDMAFETGASFEFVHSYLTAFLDKGLIDLQRSTERRHAGEVVKVSLTLSGMLSLTQSTAGVSGFDRGREPGPRDGLQ